MGGRNIALVALILLLVPTVFAGSFDATIDPLNNRVTIQEIATFKLTILNTDTTFDDYELSFVDVGLWDQYYTQPLSDYYSGINNVVSGESHSTKIFLQPIAGIGVGFHEVTLKIKSKLTGHVKDVKIPVYVQSLSANIDFLPHIQVGFSLPPKIDPRKSNELTVLLENRNRKNITGAELIVSSDTININKIISLEPLERKELTFPLTFDARQNPLEDSLDVKVDVGKYTFESDPVTFQIIDYTGIFDVAEEKTSRFLGVEKVRIYKNNGNKPRTETISEQTSVLGDMFKTSEPIHDSVINKDGKRFRAWQIVLQPGESFSLTLTENYRSIAYILILLVVLYILFLVFRSPIQAKKEAKNIAMREGGISEVKIVLNIKNVSNHTLEEVEVRDTIPNIANITNEFDMGTVRPHRILRHEGKGATVVEWKLDELDPHEDRVITYTIRSKLPVLGQFNLPTAIVKFQQKKGGKRVKVSSNRLRIGG